MAGHSKWANIKNRKKSQDLIKSKIFAKLTKEIIVAATLGGANLEVNPTLKLVIHKAKSKSLPNKAITNALKKAIGDKNTKIAYKEYLYEGYLPFQIAIIIRCLTSNHNHLASQIKAIFNKLHGSLAKKGATNYLFQQVGIIQFANSIANEAEIIEFALKQNVIDVISDKDSYCLICDPKDFFNIKQKLDLKYKNPQFKNLEIIFKPKTLVKLNHIKTKQILTMLTKIENTEDVQEVFHNLDLSRIEK